MSEEIGLFRVDFKDILNGLAVSVFGAVFAVLLGVVQTPDFNVLAINWSQVGTMMLNAAIYSFVGYMSKKFFQAPNGKIFGKIPLEKKVEPEN